MVAIVRPSVDGMGKPLVDIPIRQTNEGGSVGVQLKSAITAISGLKLERLGIGRRGRGKENLDIQDGGNELLGKLNFQEFDLGLSSYGGV